MSEFLKVHHLTEDPNTHEVRVVKTNPYIRIKGAGPVPLFLRNGHVWDENGNQILPVPGWIPEALKALSDAALREVGFKPEVVHSVALPVAKETETEEVTEDEKTPQPVVRQAPPRDWRKRAKAATA